MLVRGSERTLGRSSARRVHAFGAAPVVHEDQAVLAGRGGVHPPQLALDPQPGLVEVHHRRGGEVRPRPLQEPAQPTRCAGGHRRDRALGDRGPNSSANAAAVRFLDRNSPT